MVEKLPEVKSGPVKIEYVELVTVFETMDLGLIAIAKSLLEGAGIQFFAKNERIQGLFLGAASIEIQVGKLDVEAAKDILVDFIDNLHVEE